MRDNHELLIRVQSIPKRPSETGVNSERCVNFLYGLGSENMTGTHSAPLVDAASAKTTVVT
jgi:hypothetical protein